MDEIAELAKQTRLSVHEVQMWLDHLEAIGQNRKRGGVQAAETLRQRKLLTTMKHIAVVCA